MGHYSWDAIGGTSSRWDTRGGTTEVGHQRWKGECLVMGDFNEVRSIDERWGSTFNKQGADLFNSFISSSGLIDIQMEGYSFTWAHLSASKMNLPGFDEMISSSWAPFNLDDLNAMIRFKKKLKLLKVEILIKPCKTSPVKGVMVDGDRVVDPIMVKKEFRDHFANRFQDPGPRKSRINFQFPNRLSSEQVADLEARISTDEIRSAVWGCAFSLSFNRLVEAGTFKGYKSNPYLTFVTFVLRLMMRCFFIVEWSQDNLMGIMHILRCFSILSGITINFQKSQLLGVGICDNHVIKAAKFIGCSTMKTPFRYLGILVGDNMANLKAWDETIAKMIKRLSKWKLNTLSIGGRLTLLKSVLGSTPIYNMSIYKVPKLVLNHMERLRRDFFYGVKDGDRKIAWIKWTKVLASKKFGGLGVSSLFALNRALIFKWVWRFFSYDNSFMFSSCYCCGSWFKLSSHFCSLQFSLGYYYQRSQSPQR
ncbi:hypothetical protein Tco_0684252 [Tanacetum coccineum]